MSETATANPSERVQRALARASTDLIEPIEAWSVARARSKRVLIGDPQAPFEKFLRILDHRELIGDDGRLAPDVQLVSMGDHFDWGKAVDRERAAFDGLLLLSWLAAHPPDQVTLIIGNHDLARVGELATFDDKRFVEIQREADEVYVDGHANEERERAFLVHVPQVPTAESVARDFGTFRVDQRDRVLELLRAGRFRIAAVLDDNMIACHAGVTADDLTAVGLGAEHHHDARRVADALNGVLDDAVAAGTKGPLSLGPLHHPGDAAYGEGRGIFYHRPSNPAHESARYFEGPPRRRFDPRRLPRGLTQLIGHIRDNKCRSLLGEWADKAEAIDGPLRHLLTDGTSVRYAHGLASRPGREQAMMVFLDGGMSHAPIESYQLLDADRWRPL
jgi:hypothetical protein